MVLRKALWQCSKTVWVVQKLVKFNPPWLAKIQGTGFFEERVAILLKYWLDFKWIKLVNPIIIAQVLSSKFGNKKMGLRI